MTAPDCDAQVDKRFIRIYGRGDRAGQLLAVIETRTLLELIQTGVISVHALDYVRPDLLTECKG